jgi:hypothetical protein
MGNDPVRSYGWLPDLPDQRDHRYAAPLRVLSALPSMVDLRGGQAPVYDQLQLGSCTAQAISGALEYDRGRQGLPRVPPSRLFIYFNERVLEGTTESDAGATIRDGIKTVSAQGACPEPMWPYEVRRFAEHPTDDCYTEATHYRALTYRSVTPTLAELRGCLADSNPFVFGFSVYSSFETQQVASTGDAPIPRRGERLLGGHAVLAVGYDDASQRFLARNSWGEDWGKGGYFTLPYAYLTNNGLASDFWTITTVSGETPAQHPTLGQKIIVTADPARNNGATEAPAIITRVWSDTLINARVILDSNEIDWVTSVTLYATPEDLAAARARRDLEMPHAAGSPFVGAYWPPRA